MNGNNGNGHPRGWLAVTTLLTVLASLGRALLVALGGKGEPQKPDPLEHRLQRLEDKLDQVLQQMRKEKL